MIEPFCHCGAVKLKIAAPPETVTDCNCSIRRRYGVLRAYYSPGQVRIASGEDATDIHMWDDRPLEFHHCPQLRLCHALGLGRPVRLPRGSECKADGTRDPGGCARAPSGRRKFVAVSRWVRERWRVSRSGRNQSGMTGAVFTPFVCPARARRSEVVLPLLRGLRHQSRQGKSLAARCAGADAGGFRADELRRPDSCPRSGRIGRGRIHGSYLVHGKTPLAGC